MRLLLDSHAFLWFCEGNNALSAAARTAIENTANEVFLSHAAAWEIAIKVSLGKLQLQAPYEALIPARSTATVFACYSRLRAILRSFSSYPDTMGILLIG